MKTELKVYQESNQLQIDRIQASIDKATRDFTINLYQQDFIITLKKDELKYVSRGLKNYLEEQQGIGKDEYTVRGDRSILNILKFSNSPLIREKYYEAIASSSKENIPSLLQILYHRLKKAQHLGHDNYVPLYKDEKAFKIDNLIGRIETARNVLNQSFTDDVNLIQLMTGDQNYNITTSIFEKDYIKRQLELSLISSDLKAQNLHNIFTFSNTLNGMMIMIK